MNIKILTPEIVVFEGEVDSVLLPGEMGEFHILNNHAAVVSSLKMGKVKLVTRSIENENQAKFFTPDPANNYFSFKINGGVVEFKDNKGIILCD
ncbi:MAG: F0F1 ATP synthase subunit epsilon [Cloacibacterium sp.]|jgi:F-type H+-transporting ATPase subunit epsilon|nr:F0F1 ATP synthase subunit epsilon [Cloacibacterium sp.]